MLDRDVADPAGRDLLHEAIKRAAIGVEEGVRQEHGDGRATRLRPVLRQIGELALEAPHDEVEVVREEELLLHEKRREAHHRAALQLVEAAGGERLESTRRAAAVRCSCPHRSTYLEREESMSKM